MIWAVGSAALGVMLQSVVAWRLSTRYRCASIADIFWPLHHLLAASILLIQLPATDAWMQFFVMGLLMVWATRLATHLTIRQAGAPEDRRYQAIRQRVGDDFDRQSLRLIFIPQSLMAWFMAMLLIPALIAPAWSLIAYAGLGLAAVGLIWEVAADVQLAAFLKGPKSAHVLDTGLWSICRHPNYFGEWLFWVGLAITAFSLSENFAFFAGLPILLLTFLLLRFTGVARTEGDISGRRPEYRAYQQAVPAFFPNPVELWRKIADHLAERPKRFGRQLGWWVLLPVLATSYIEPASASTDATQSWLFDVKIDGKEVGYHRFTTSRDEDGFDVKARAEFRYKILGVTVFSYDHEVTEQYDPNMCLQSIASETKTNGDIQRLQGSSNAGSFVLQTNTASVVDESCLITFAYWSPSLLTRQKLLNGQTGDLVDISIAQLTPKGEGSLTNTYSLTGEKIDITLDYNAQGDWRALESRLDNGRKLSYHLRP